VCAAATMTARTAWLQAAGSGTTGGVPAAVVADCNLVDQLMNCLVKNYSCPLVQTFVPVDPTITRVSHYSIYQSGGIDAISQFVFRYMYNLTATTRGKPCKQITDCDDGWTCVTGQCMSGLTRFHDAYGTGLELQTSGLFIVKDPTKGTWTESTWNPVGFRLFKLSSTMTDTIQLAIGFVITVATLASVLVSRKMLKKTFKIA